MTEQRTSIGNWIKLNPHLESHRIGYEDVLRSANAGASAAFKLAPVLPPLSAPFGELRSRVLTSQRIRNAIELLTTSLSKPQADIAAVAAAQYDSMAANLDPIATRSLFFLVAPFINKMFSNIFVNCQALERLRTAMLRHPVVLLPTHRSYLDFILLDIALYICNMPLPTIAAATDFSSMRVFGEWLRRCGAFFVQRGTGSAANLVTTTVNNGGATADESPEVRPLLVVDDESSKAKDWQFLAADYLHRALLAEYIHQLVVYGHHRFLEFFIEGKRSRTGKACPPKRGLLNSIAEAFLHGDVDDIYLCPVSICYDRFLEESLYARELLGWPKPKESTAGLLKSTKVLLSNNYGSVVFTFGEPISLRNMSQGRINRQLHALHPAWIGAQTVGERNFLTELALYIIDKHHELTSLPVFSLVACCVASAVLTQEMDSISSPVVCTLPQLIERVRWIVDLLTASHRSASLSISHSLDSTILDVIRLHSNILALNREDGSVSLKGSDAITSPAAGTDVSEDPVLHSIIQLCIYRNQAMFALFPVTIISLGITTLADNQHEISVDSLYSRFVFLTNLLRLEFVSSHNCSESNDKSCNDVFQRTLLFMLENHLLFKTKQSDFDVQRSKNSDTLFLSSLLQPFVFGYSLCCSFLLLRSSAPSIVLQSPVHSAFLDRLATNPARTILSQVLTLSKCNALPPSASWSLSSDLIGNAIAAFSEMGLLARPVSNSKPLTVQIHKMEELQEKIASYLPAHYPSTATTLASIVFFTSNTEALSNAESSSKKARRGIHSKL